MVKIRWVGITLIETEIVPVTITPPPPPTHTHTHTHTHTLTLLYYRPLIKYL